MASLRSRLPSVLLLSWLLTGAASAAPLTSLASPVPGELAGCVEAACTAEDAGARVCLCRAEEEAVACSVVLERAEREPLRWDGACPQRELTDFGVRRGDLDGDGAAEWVVETHVALGNGLGVDFWEVAIVPGKDAAAPLRFRAEDYGAASLVPLPRGKGARVLATEWQFLTRARRPAGAWLVGRTYRYEAGRLVPTAEPVRMRRLRQSFASSRRMRCRLGERATYCAAASLQHPDVERASVDPVGGPPKARGERVERVEREGACLLLHLAAREPMAAAEPMRTGCERANVARLADRKTRRAFPADYVPADAEAWLTGARVQLAGDVLWVDTPAAVR